MKRPFSLWYFSLIVVSSCAKKDTPPSYSDFTPISGQFTVSELGKYRPTKRDTTAVLSNLQLRINSGYPTTDAYEFRGDLTTRESINIQFFVPKNRVGDGPWLGLQVNTTTYTNKQTASTGFAQAAGVLSANGNSFTASYDFLDQHGTLK
jgi:hypothetical protein